MFLSSSVCRSILTVSFFLQAEDLDAALVVDSDGVHRHAFGWSAVSLPSQIPHSEHPTDLIAHRMVKLSNVATTGKMVLIVPLYVLFWDAVAPVMTVFGCADPPPG